jgi:hypothetical protein
MKRGERKGQVTIFVILALIIVGVLIVIFTRPSTNIFSSSVNPSNYLRSCIEPEIEIIKETLSDNGGYTQPDNYLMYQDKKFQYLCYTSEYYKACTVQQPLLLKKVQDEMIKHIEPRAKQCYQDLIDQYEKRGYEVKSGQSQIVVGVVPESINVEFIAPLTLIKEDTQTFDKFSVAIQSKWYDLINVATNIVQYESTYGDSETSLYISYYPNLIIEKTRRDDGSTIYQLRDVTTNDRFSFATRSLVWPQGLA